MPNQTVDATVRCAPVNDPVFCSFVNVPLPDKPHWWQWPTVLSLDAPAVTISWQWLFARLCGIELGWAEPTIVAASIWLAYVADRWFEGWRVAPSAMRTQRHRFYQQHRWAVAAVWVLVLLLDLGVAFWHLSERELIAGILLLGPTLLYLLSHQLLHRHRRWRAPKEVCIAFLLAGGAAVFVVASPAAQVTALVGPVIVFGALCFANVALIAVWEQEVDETHGQVSLARQFRGAAGVSRAFPWVLAVATAGAMYLPWPLPRAAAVCGVASALLLAALDRFEHRIGWQLARVLADFVLLTPAVLFVRAGLK